MKQKLLASAMALAMVLSLTPVTALAAEGEDTTLPEEEITVQTETPAEEIPVEEPAEPETPAEEIPVEEPVEPETPAEEIPIEEPAEPETPAEEPVEPEVPVEEVTETENTITLSGDVSGNYTVEEAKTIVVQGAVTMTGTGDAFTINADTTLEFDSGATLTLSGYTNGFVVSNATLSGGGWVINNGDGMDLFKLNTGGKLNITGNVDLNGTDKTEATASRAIFLPWGTSGQAVTLGENVTLAANNFYRGMETGGASNYTISGAGMNSSEFDFSNNNCGMALSYFDSNARFENCTLEVSNCDASGIFMRQDNAALDGLYIDNVKINCVNDIDLDQTDIAIRFHSNNFEITDSVINIENAWNTGLWIYDGWNANEQNEITGTTITVKHVEDNNALSSLFTVPNRRKAMTFVPYRDWLISDCEFNIHGASSASTGKDNEMEGGINVASDIALNRNNSLNPSSWTATPGMHGGKVIFEDTKITTSGIIGADVGAQVGQWIEIGKNVVIENGKSDNHYTVVCDDIENGYPVQFLGRKYPVTYITTGMSDYNKNPNRLAVIGGSYFSTRSEDVDYKGIDVPFNCSIPVNGADEDLTMFTVSYTAYETYVQDGVITLLDKNGEEYDYIAEEASGDTNRYIWAPEATVTFVNADGSENTVVVPKGPAFGLTKTVEPGNWVTDDGELFTDATEVTRNITVTAQ